MTEEEINKWLDKEERLDRNIAHREAEREWSEAEAYNRHSLNMARLEAEGHSLWATWAMRMFHLDDKMLAFRFGVRRWLPRWLRPSAFSVGERHVKSWFRPAKFARWFLAKADTKAMSKTKRKLLEGKWSEIDSQPVMFTIRGRSPALPGRQATVRTREITQGFDGKITKETTTEEPLI